MKRYVEKEEEEETTNELTDWVGVVLSDRCRGAILNTGGAFHIICSETVHNTNVTCGDKEADGGSVKDTIVRWKNLNGAVKIKSIYCFDSYKELMQWFADGITD
jgi:hypothetical protein